MWICDRDIQIHSWSKSGRPVKKLQLLKNKRSWIEFQNAKKKKWEKEQKKKKNPQKLRGQFVENKNLIELGCSSAGQKLKTTALIRLTTNFKQTNNYGHLKN